MSESKFRFDINGLRAIAVLSVVLYHFDLGILPGGFAGVDVFFVISGYLMTSIIFKKVNLNNFSFKEFYIARFNRIVPPLTILCFFLLFYGWFFQYDSVYRDLVKHATTSLTFVSNYFYWKEASYFDSGKDNILLHTWSLSAEWQFYLIYPLLIGLFAKLFNLKVTKYFILFAAILGFGVSVVLSHYWPSASYFLLPTRAWEMLFGGVAYIFPFSLKRLNKIKVELTGIVFILFSVFFFNQNILWPGYAAIIPVLGTYLVILANRNNSIITNNFMFNLVGKWSYSVYLWHWPVYLMVSEYFPSSFAAKIFGLLLSFLLGFLSYHLIERKVRGIYALIIYLLLLAFATTLYFSEGVSNRPLSKEPRNILANSILDKYSNYTMDPSGYFTDCNAAFQYQKSGTLKIESKCINDISGGVFLWGDSHLGAIATGIRSTFPNLPYSQLTSASCPPSFSQIKVGPSSLGCNYSNKIASEMIQRSRPKVVILATRDDHQSVDWLKTIRELHNIGVRKVIVVGPLPQWLPSLPKVYVKRHLGSTTIKDDSFVGSLVISNDYMKSISENNKGFIYIDVLSGLCSELDHNKSPTCLVKVNDELLAFDYGHLTIEGSRYIAEKFLSEHLAPMSK